MATVKDILNDTPAFVEEKRAAAFDEKQGLAGQDPNTYPGAEHDKPVDSSMEQPDPGANEDVNSPPGAYSADGAKPANQKEQGTALEATDPPPASVKREAEVSGDAMAGPNGSSRVGDQPVAKHAELAANLLSSIKKAQSVEEPEDNKTAETKCAKCGEMYKGESCTCEKKAEADPAKPEDSAEGTPVAPEEKAGEEVPTNEINLTQDVLAKIAETMLATS